MKKRQRKKEFAKLREKHFEGKDLSIATYPLWEVTNDAKDLTVEMIYEAWKRLSSAAEHENSTHDYNN